MELRILVESLLRPFAGLTPAQSASLSREAAADLMEYARLTSGQSLEKLASSAEGLLSREADERFVTYGANAVAHEAHKSPARQLVELFLTPLSLLLLVLASASYLTGETKGAVVIAIMVVLSSLLSFV